MWSPHDLCSGRPVSSGIWLVPRANLCERSLPCTSYFVTKLKSRLGVYEWIWNKVLSRIFPLAFFIIGWLMPLLQ
jgi:hypothetical protein